MKGSSQGAPVGVFDSGLGGLSVTQALARALPHEDLVYLGDTARVPYGVRSEKTVVRYALACAEFLQRRGIKALVVACNTVSAVALEALRASLTIPVLGVIEPGARSAVALSRSGVVGIIATPGTVASQAYPKAIARLCPELRVLSVEAPLLVPLVEEGWWEGQVPRLVIRHYLQRFEANTLDTLILGCTHYPLLAPLILDEGRACLGSALQVIDGASATAEALRALLEERQAFNAQDKQGRLQLVFTDRTARASAFLERVLGLPSREVSIEEEDLS